VRFNPRVKCTLRAVGCTFVPSRWGGGDRYLSPSVSLGLPGLLVISRNSAYLRSVRGVGGRPYATVSPASGSGFTARAGAVKGGRAGPHLIRSDLVELRRVHFGDNMGGFDAYLRSGRWPHVVATVCCAG